MMAAVGFKGITLVQADESGLRKDDCTVGRLL